MMLKPRKLRSSKAKTSHAKRCGIAAVEFAIVAPVLLLLIFMMVEASRFLSSLHATSGAAREVARLVALGDIDQATAEEQAKDFMKLSYFRTGTVKVRITNEDSDVEGFEMVSVVVSIDYSDVSVVGDPFNLGVNEVSGFSSMFREE